METLNRYTYSMILTPLFMPPTSFQSMIRNIFTDHSRCTIPLMPSRLSTPTNLLITILSTSLHNCTSINPIVVVVRLSSNNTIKLSMFAAATFDVVSNLIY
jgi:hypothetical protein